MSNNDLSHLYRSGLIYTEKQALFMRTLYLWESVICIYMYIHINIILCLVVVDPSDYVADMGRNSEISWILIFWLSEDYIICWYHTFRIVASRTTLSAILMTETYCSIIILDAIFIKENVLWYSTYPVSEDAVSVFILLPSMLLSPDVLFEKKTNKIFHYGNPSYRHIRSTRIIHNNLLGVFQGS